MTIKSCFTKGGNIEVIEWICLGQNPGTFALRKLLPLSSLIKSGSTKRQKDLEDVGLSFGLNFNSERIKKNNLLEKFSFFKTKKIEYIFNKLSRKEDNFSVFDITFSEGEAIAKELCTQQCCTSICLKTFLVLH